MIMKSRFLILLFAYVSVSCVCAQDLWTHHHVEQALARKSEEYLDAYLEPEEYQSSDRNEKLYKSDDFKTVLKLLTPSLFSRDLIKSLNAEDNYEDNPFDDIPDWLKAYLFPGMFAPESSECYQETNILIQTLMLILITPNDPNIAWAIKVLDANGKIPDSILTGNLNPIGNYDECLKIVGPTPADKKANITGKYCSGYLQPGINASIDIFDGYGSSDPFNFAMFMEMLQGLPEEAVRSQTPMIKGICVPSSCTEAQIKRVYMEKMFNTTITFLGPCKTSEEEEFSNGENVLFAVAGAYGTLLALCTLFDILRTMYYELYKGQKCNICQHPRNITLEACQHPQPPAKSWKKYVFCFSIYTNLQKLLNPSVPKGDIGCLHGMRVITMTWVMLGHGFSQLRYPFLNGFDKIKSLDDWAMQPIVNAYISVDTFFFLSGLLATYNILREFSKLPQTGGIPGMKVASTILLTWLNRFIRLTPALGMTILIAATVYPRFVEGPGAGLAVTEITETCQDHWFQTLLYYYNLMDIDHAFCLPHSWYLAVDYQLLLVLPLFVIPLYYKPKLGYMLMGLATALSIIVPLALTASKHLAPTMLFMKPQEMKDYYLNIYIRPWSRFSPYIVGMWLGYYLFKRNGKPVNVPKIAAVAGWVIAIVLNVAIVYGLRDYFNQDLDWRENEALSAAYGGFHRFVWACGMAWVVFACQNNCAGFINDVLSWEVFLILGRLTYCVYLVHYPLQVVYHSSWKTIHYYDHWYYVYAFFGDVMIMHMVAVGMSLTCEVPFMRIFKMSVSAIRGTDNAVDMGSKEEKLISDYHEKDVVSKEGEVNGGYRVTEDENVKVEDSNGAAHTPRDEKITSL